MREFILLALKAKTSPDINLDDLVGEGRLDLVCRAVSSALFLSHKIRRDAVIHVAMSGPKIPPKLLSFYGDTWAGITPDEKAIAEAIKRALTVGANLVLGEEKDVQPGVKVAKKAFETLVKEKSQTSQLIYLHPKGEDIRHFKFEPNPVFVLGDFLGLPKKTEKLLDRLGAKKI
ncbi:tRNA (pseudouridine(54)-N(1))-methyltransferase TrmY, partial [Candidatus Woesearchaeota archaeon]|nr:tRNA (pseudouridine(54)-N(1))-methyltransferase TrmY [Candidatus Woesearchaeota archaeon]